MAQSASRRYGFVARLVLILLGIILAGTILEVGLRLAGFGNTWTPSKRYTRYHAVFGWEKLPNGGGWFYRPEYRTHLRLNSKGLRGREYGYEKKPGTFRILVLGDSFVEGYSVNQDDLVTEFLEKELNTGLAGTRVEVINGGTSGYSTDQELLFFSEEGMKYKPDLVILMMFHNDIYYNSQRVYREYAKPLFFMQNGRLVLTNVPVPFQEREGRKNATEESDEIDPEAGIVKRAASNLLLYRVAGQKVRASLPGLSERLRKIGFMRAAPALTKGRLPEEELDVFRRTDTPAFTSAWSMTEAIVKEFSHLARASRVELILFVIPDKIEVYPGDWKATQKTYGISEKEWDLRKPGRRIREIAGRLGLAVVDPLPEFQQTAERGKRLYYEGDGHWNADGHRLAARIIHRYLVEHNLANGPPIASDTVMTK